MRSTSWFIATGAVALTLVCGAGVASAQPTAGRQTHASPATSSALPYGTIATVEEQGSEILIFAPGSTATSQPVRTILKGPGTGQLHAAFGGVAFDRSGDIYVADSGTTIDEFAPDADGAATAIRTITTGLQGGFGLAVAPDGSIWQLTCSSCGQTGAPKLVEFAPTASGSATPERTISGASTTLDPQAARIALSADGSRVWVANSFDADLLAFETTQDGDVAPLSTLNLSALYPQGISTDVDGDLIVSALSSSAAHLYKIPPGAGGQFPSGVSTATPAIDISGSNTGFHATSSDDADDVTTLPYGDALVSVYNASSSFAFSLAASGNVAPIFSLPSGGGGTAVYDAAPTAPRVVKAQQSTKKIVVRWSAPASTGGGLTGYQVYRRTSTKAPWSTLGVPVSTPTYVDESVQAKHRYYYGVQAVNAVGFSALSSVSAYAGTAPGTPGQVKVRHGHKRITVNWKKPKHLGVPTLTSYLVAYSSCKSAPKRCKLRVKTVSARHHKLVISHLKAGHRYYVSVSARNPAGVGKRSKRKSAKTE